MLDFVDWVSTWLFKKSRHVPGMPDFHNPFVRFLSRQEAEQDVDRALVLAGTPRSGTTWLAETLKTIPGAEVLMEPFDPGRHPEVEQYGVHMNTYIAPNTDAPETEEYVESVLKGRVRSLDMLHSDFSLRRVLGLRHPIVKCVRGNRLLPWIERTFRVPSLLLVRHPCAVVSSQLRFPSGWNETKYRVEEGDIRSDIDAGEWRHPNLLLDDFPALREVYRSIRTVEEYLAFEWAADVWVPFSFPTSTRYVVNYERLVTNGRKELEHIFTSLGRSVPGAAYEQLRIPSQTTKSQSNVAKGKNPLTTWREHLDAEQVRAILDVTHRLGLDFYGQDLNPDLDRQEECLRSKEHTK